MVFGAAVARADETPLAKRSRPDRRSARLGLERDVRRRLGPACDGANATGLWLMVFGEPEHRGRGAQRRCQR